MSKVNSVESMCSATSQHGKRLAMLSPSGSPLGEGGNSHAFFLFDKKRL